MSLIMTTYLHGVENVELKEGTGGGARLVFKTAKGDDCEIAFWPVEDQSFELRVAGKIVVEGGE